MSWPVELPPSRINLHNERVPLADARRQQATVREILRRLADQPGVVLADEVGMGKTFVALAVAVAVAEADQRRPVVVMVPPTLREKWPRDFDVFRRFCLPGGGTHVRAASASSALDLFRLLDDPRAQRKQIVFLAHNAFHVSLGDRWVKLAFIKRAMHGLHLGERRAALPRFAADLIRTTSSYSSPELFERLLAADYDRWKDIINTHAPSDQRLDDDPIPAAVQRVLQRDNLDLGDLRECLRQLPSRVSDNIDSRLTAARRVVNQAVKAVWPQALGQARFRSPLLILDEAHHLKNDETRLASLFADGEEAADQASEDGALDGAFERMLFLTATPFQLGHHELLNVLDRFSSISWDSLPSATREGFAGQRAALREALDGAQRATAELDHTWRRVRWDDIGSTDAAAVETWWRQLLVANGETPERLQEVRRSFLRARESMKAAGELLRPWVIRHVRARELPNSAVPRRHRLTGAGLRTNDAGSPEGLTVASEAVLPFLLAARSQAVVSRKGPQTGAAPFQATFAEGLASSYEAFLETRAVRLGDRGHLKDESAAASTEADPRLDRYLDRLHQTLPSRDLYARHPKMAALLERVVDLWSRGEKVVIFSHFRATGRALARHVSAAIEQRLWSDAATRSRLELAEARERVRTTGDAFDDGRPLQRALHSRIEGFLQDAPDISEQHRQQIHDVVRRFVRTPLFVARYFDFQGGDHAETLGRALLATDASGFSLEDKIRAFIAFAATRCEEGERQEYLEALESIHPGLRGERARDSEDFVHDGPPLLPNVRLAYGGVTPETRRRLLLGFNTPFLPEVLVASSVLAEGVDLHLNCRYIIHYDLDWNPSTIEQRTGRVDRIGAKAERAGQPIHVYMPYVAGTQDEKMFRVVTDRERWFQVLMGEQYRTDETATDKLAERVPLPESAAADLMFRLAVVDNDPSAPCVLRSAAPSGSII